MDNTVTVYEFITQIIAFIFIILLVLGILRYEMAIVKSKDHVEIKKLRKAYRKQEHDYWLTKKAQRHEFWLKLFKRN